MNTIVDKEYKVLVTHLPVTESNGQSGYWQATVMGFPNIAEKAFSREQVIQQIQTRLVEIMRHSEIVALTVPASPPPTATEDEDGLLVQGWEDHGLFKDEPEALKLFDEVEEERDRHLVGNE